MAANADVVTTTTPELAQHLRRLNPNVVVVPNSVDPEEWTVAPRAPNRKIRIGWQGGSTHFRDLILVTEALSALARKRDFTFVIYGLTDMPSVKNVYRKHLKTFGDRFRHSPEGLTIKTFLKKTERLPYEFHPFVNTSNYVSTLCGLALDIGIAPLLDTPFNRKKSSIKYYEYGMSGAVTVASNVLPYSAEVPRLADNTTSAWEAQLTDLLSADLQSLWRSQYDWIMSHRNIEQNVVMWEKAFEANASASHLHQAVGDARQVPQVPPSPEGSSALADGLLTC
jgi:glycosyltransferase involved in cell wall biosynthesis